MKILFSVFLLLAGLSVQAGSWLWSGEIKKDEQILFFPAEAYYDHRHKQWYLDVHGWVFEQKPFGELVELFRKTLGIDSDHDNESKTLFRQRIRWFLVDNERDKQVKILLGNLFLNAGKSAANGHFNSRQPIQAQYLETLKQSAQDKPVSFRANLPKHDKRLFNGQLHIIPPTGLSVISDIDDTIKISNVTNKQELLANTFKRPFKTAPGMADLYQQWKTKENAVFHYVSASPWQLYPVLSGFMQQQGYPSGLFHMKSFRWKDNSFFNLFADPVEYKMQILETIFKRYPQRQFILVGDSGEKDPEVYGMIARKYPQRIRQILIRQVGDNNGKQRFTEAFANINKSKWQVFKGLGTRD